MNKVKEFLINVLDEGEVTSVKDMKWPSFKVNKCLFFSMAFLFPLMGCLLGSTFMDVESREFIVMTMILMLNVLLFLCWYLYCFMKVWEASLKEKLVTIGVSVLFVVGAFFFI